MILGIQPVFSRPGHPQDNGAHERMHRELKAKTTRPPGSSFAEQQNRFDEFVHTYNFERPHEGIDMQRPARLFRSSPRPFPRRAPKPEYAEYFEKRRVGPAGDISWRGKKIFISEAFAGQIIALECVDEGFWSLHFHAFTIGTLDERKHGLL